MLTISFLTKAQKKIFNSANTEESVQNLYHQSIGFNQAIFNGQEYFHRMSKLTGHVFWNENIFKNGSVSFDGNIYPNIPLKLDLLNEELITYRTNTTLQVKITKEKIDSFNIADTRFIHLTQNIDSKMPEGFYEVLHQGKYIVICKRIKTIKEIVSPDGVENKIEQKNNYYINDKGEYKEIKSRQILYDFFKDKKESVLQYAKQENLNYKTDTESYILFTIKYYEQITN
ncbi:MAG: hypothetical protein LC122_08135 [Chitinophagales bacterium]|nr:hypothetical protein [Chitinophagales bacterium]